MKNLRLVLDTYARNFRFTQWPKTVLEPFDEPAKILNEFHTAKAAIDVDLRLAPRGNDEARVNLGKTALAAIVKWHTPRLAGLDADLGIHRAALVPPSTEKPDGRRLDFLLSHLRDRTPDEIAVFYNSATDEERLAMEAAAASVGRVPMKTANGLQWQ